ncbi:hypothetical protein GPA19_07890 [Azoarcus indigens]|uniref:Uncharacterized protein n=1 Tax=Azoarcus indigens TaxID=29545 RepID=A0A4R6DYK6_9RHOO|nr:hypothetical protein [Azoarcus indigens]NMG64864.1 hypothetical protein [Azoarcus indigens]TDN50403.1 hypothetical protein C7389_10997 [Azoarcus indigens]
MPSQFEKRTCRPRDHLEAIGRRYPGAWKAADDFRVDRGQGLPDWADWCYLPLAAAYAIVSGGGPNRVPIRLMADVGALGALMAWRVTQGIYRFDPALYERLIDTPVSGDIPHEILYRLPEWCVYVETPGLQIAANPLHGFFAHLEDDPNNGRVELRLVLDAASGLAPLPLHLGAWSLAESIQRMIDTASVQALGLGMGALPVGQADALRPVVEPIISLLLYLCAEAAEIGAGDRRPANPIPKRTKRGWRLFAADKPTSWDVGVRMGAALRAAYHAAETDGGAAHAGPRGHVRRAHWHTFVSGRRIDDEGTPIPADRRRRDVRWVPPIQVNLPNVDDMPAVIKPVK